MISGKQLHGLRVYDKNGTQVGIVQDMTADRSSGAVRGFIISSTGILSKTAFIPSSRVLHLDEYGMVICGRGKAKKAALQRENGEMHLGELVSSKGHVTDIFLEKDRIWAAELSQGLLADINAGRQIYPWDEL